MINKLSKEIHKNAVEKGWYDKEVSFTDVISMCHCELSEALTEYRDNKPMIYYNCTDYEFFGEPLEPCQPKDYNECNNYGKEKTCKWRSDKPEGIAVELIDCVLRIFDYLASKEVDIEEVIRLKTEYNKTRGYRHGGKKV